MFSSNRLLLSNISRAAMFTSLSAARSTARAKETAVWSVDTSTRVMPSQLEIFVSTQNVAGVTKLWQRLTRPGILKLRVIHCERVRMGQLPKPSIVWQRRLLPIVTVSILQLRHGGFSSCALVRLDLMKSQRAESYDGLPRARDLFKSSMIVDFRSWWRPDYHIPSMQTVSRDVKKVFVQVRKRIAKMLQVILIFVVQR